MLMAATLRPIIMIIGARKTLRRDNVAILAGKRELVIAGRRTAYTDENWDILAEVIRKTTSLEELEFKWQHAIALQNDKFIEALAKNRSIKSLSVWSANGGDEEAKAVAAILKENSTIDLVHLGHSDIGVEGAKAIAEALKENKILRFIKLYANQMGDEGGKAIADALKQNDSLHELRIGRNNIGVQGAKAIADALKQNDSLHELSIGRNNIGVEGARVIAEALKENTSLQKLFLGSNSIGVQGAKAIADALKHNKTVRYIDLDNNHIGSVGAKAIGEALKHNKSLLHIRLTSNPINEEGGKHILDALQQIEVSAIENIDLWWDQISSRTGGRINDIRGEYEISEETQTKIKREIARIRINTSRAKIEEQQSTISQLQGKIAEQDKEIASMKDIMKKIGEMVIGSNGGTASNVSNASMPDRETELQTEIERYKQEIDSLKEQLKNSRPIDTVDLTNEVEPASSSGGEDSNEEEPTPKRRRMKSNLAVALEQTRQMVEVKEEAKERAAVAEANMAVARREKDAVEASLREKQEDLEDSEELVTQQTLATNILQGRIDELCELARAAGVDGSLLSEIRYRPLSGGR